MVIKDNDLKNFTPYDNFKEASKPVLAALHERLGFDLWMVTRTHGDEWKVLVVEDFNYGVKPDTTLCWSDSFCSRMVQGLGPCIAPDVANIPAYVQAPISQDMKIGAYIGIPLVRQSGTLFGTLCAISPEPQPDHILEEMDFIMMNARLISTLINMELDGEDISAQLRSEKMLSRMDELTGIYNRRGWEIQSMIEEQRCQRYNLSASVLIIDLDDFKAVNDSYGHIEGDLILRKTATCLISSVRVFDVVSRIGGDEFALLVIDSSDDLVHLIVERIRNKLADENIRASIGWADIRGLSLTDAMRKADEMMYKEKRRCQKLRHAP